MEQVLSNKQQAIDILSTAGMNTKVIGNLLGYKGNSIDNAKHNLQKIKRKGLRVYSKAGKCVDLMLHDYMLDRSSAKDSDILTIWNSEKARVDPIVNISKSLNVNVSFTEVPLDVMNE